VLRVLEGWITAIRENAVPLRSNARVAITTAVLLVTLALPAAALAAAPVTIGTGHKPGVAVDAAGTAYSPGTAPRRP
jgi:hypothetical protein